MKLPNLNKEYLNEDIVTVIPELVSIPITDHVVRKAEVLIGLGQEVKKGDLIAYKLGFNKIPVFASVSGTVTAVEKVMHYSGKLVDAITITNNKEEVQEQKLENVNLTKTSTLVKLNKYGLKNFYESPLAQYLKEPTRFEIETLVIDATNSLPYVNVSTKLFVTKLEEIVDGIMALKVATRCENAVIAINNDLEIDLSLLEAKNISVSRVSKGNSHLVKYTKLKGKGFNLKYGKHALSNGILVVDPLVVYASYKAIYTDMPLVDTFVTVANTENSGVYQLPVGANASLIATKEGSVLAGNSLRGHEHENNNFVLTLNTEGVIYRGGKVTNSLDEEACIRCGLCNDNCPVGLLPQAIVYNEKAKDYDRLVKLEVYNCLECGLCAFNCPSNIPLTQWVQKAKRRVL